MIRKLWYQKFGFKNSRLVFSRPSMDINEFLSHEASEAVRVEVQAQKSFEAVETQNEPQAVEDVRLGIGRKLSLAIERNLNMTVGEAVHQEALHQTERATTKQEIEDERLRMGWIDNKFSKLWSCAINNTLGLVSENYDEVGIRLRGKYAGRTRFLLFPPTVRSELQKKYVLAEEVWAGIVDPAQRTAIMNSLIAQGVPPVAPPVPPYVTDFQVGRLANANLIHLQQVQAACPFLPRRRVSLPMGTEPIIPETPFGRLLKLVGQADETKRDTLHTTVLDSKRLQPFLDQLRSTEPETADLIDRILVEDGLYALQNEPAASTLVSYLMYRYHHPPTPTLRQELERIHAEIPGHKTIEGESDEQKEQRTKIENHRGIMQDTFREIRKKYPTAQSLGQNIFQARERYDSLAADDRSKPTALSNLQRLESLRATQQADINALEAKYIENAQEFLADINEISPITAAMTELNAFNGAGLGTMRESSEEELFGTVIGGAWSMPVVPPGAAKNHILAMNIRQYAAMKREVTVNYFEAQMMQKERLSCKQLLVFLKEGDMWRAGITNPEERQRLGYMAASLMITDAENMQLFMSTNQELAERVGGTTLGSNRLDRLRKYLIAKTTDKQIYTVREIIDQLASRDKKFRMFDELPQDITLAELRDRRNEFNVNDPKVFIEYNYMLMEVYKSFEILQSGGKVELFDGDAMDLQRLIKTINILKTEMRAEAFFRDVRKHKGRKVDRIIQKMTEDELAELQEEEELMASITDRGAQWKQWFSKAILKRDTMANYMTTRQWMDENKLSKAEREEKLWESGLKATHAAFGTTVAVAGALHTGRDVAKWTWDKILEPIGRRGFYKPAASVYRFSGRQLRKPFNWAGRILGRKNK